MTQPPLSGDHLSHHLSSLAAARQDSPLKSLYKYAAIPDMIPLAGGMPHPSLFPFETLEAVADMPHAFSADPKAQPNSLSSTWSWIWNLFSSKPDRTYKMQIPKYSDRVPPQIDIATSLQYSAALGFPQLRDFLLDFTRLVHRPPPEARHMILITTGNTDAWAKCVLTFCEPHDAVIVEGYTYSSALSQLLPYDIVPVGVELDAEGLVPEALDKLLNDWDPVARNGRRKPHVLYTIPVGQNPTGTTMSLSRKRAIYDVCVKHDVLICEDDPYWALQMPSYESKAVRSGLQTADLVPSFLRCDWDGRVVRMDTFSKTVAPGSRLGWFTCNEFFCERLLRATETTTSMPCGFAQAFITQLVALDWKVVGFSRWINGLRAQYVARRDEMIGLMHENFDLRPESAFSYGAKLIRPMPGLVGYPKTAAKHEKGGAHRLIGFVPPVGGMFLWVRVFFDSHPDFDRLSELAAKDSSKAGAAAILADRFFVRLAQAKVLVVPGNFFDPEPDQHRTSTAAYFRLSFSSASREQMQKAIPIFARELSAFMRGN